MKIGTPAAYDAKCGVAYRAVRFYKAKSDSHRKALGLDVSPPVEQAASCQRLRERMVYWRKAARGNRAALVREYADPPEPYLTIAICETGGINGGRPLWTHHNSSYAGAYGFTHQTWAQFRKPGFPHVASQATPRQQTEVARVLVGLYGWSPWPACSVRHGLR